MRDTLYPDPEPGSWCAGSSWDRTCDPGPIGSTPQPGQLEEPDPGPSSSRPELLPPRTLSCGCCAAGCCCPNHQDVPWGRPVHVCLYHRDPRHPHPRVTSPLEPDPDPDIPF